MPLGWSNLAYGVSSDLQRVFGEFGIGHDGPRAGRSKGFGFMEMGSDAEAQAAIDALTSAGSTKVPSHRPRKSNSCSISPGTFSGPLAGTAIAAVRTIASAEDTASALREFPWIESGRKCTRAARPHASGFRRTTLSCDSLNLDLAA
jgi:hypothetical protein